MFSKQVLNVFNNPKNAGRIKKPEGIASCYNYDGTAHVEFSFRIDSGIIKECKFRAQANPYIIAICSTITTMVQGKMVSMLFLDPYSIKTTLGDESEYDIEFCIDCIKLAVLDYKEKIEKINKHGKKNKDLKVDDSESGAIDDFKELEETGESENTDSPLITEETNETNKEIIKDEQPDEDDDFSDFFDFLNEEA